MGPIAWSQISPQLPPLGLGDSDPQPAILFCISQASPLQGQGQDKRCEDGVIRCRDKVRDGEGSWVWAEDRLASQIQA